MSHQEKTKSVCPNERWQTTAFLFLYRKPLLCKNQISAESPLGGLGLRKSLCFTDLLWSRHNEERSGKSWRHFRWRVKERTGLRVTLWCLFIVSERSRSASMQWQTPSEVTRGAIIQIIIHSLHHLSVCPLLTSNLSVRRLNLSEHEMGFDSDE